MRPAAPCTAADPFELPEWLGLDDVTWSAVGHLSGGILPGVIRSDVSGAEFPCDLIAADVAYPVIVVDEETRVLVHESWRNGQVHLVHRDDRLALGAPGTDFAAPRVLDAIGRLAKAVGARPDRFAVRLRIARDGGGWDRGAQS